MECVCSVVCCVCSEVCSEVCCVCAVECAVTFEGSCIVWVFNGMPRLTGSP